MADRKLISIVTPCFNEEANVKDVYEAVKAVFSGLSQYRYEHIFIDNHSLDRTVEILKQIASQDKNVKIIVNARNFGHIRSGTHGYLQASGDALIPLVADLQNPPSLIPQMLAKWEQGYKIVVAVKESSEESRLLGLLRRLYYRALNRLADIELVENFMGYGLFDRQVMDIVRKIDDPYPYFRGLISEIGFEKAILKYVQPARKKGESKINWYALYDMAMLGLTSHSKIPLRFATMAGFVSAIASLFVALIYFLYKLVFWYSFNVGLAPLVIGMFFLASVQLIFLGILGEYVGAIHTHVRKLPLVVEKERYNF